MHPSQARSNGVGHCGCKRKWPRSSSPPWRPWFASNAIPVAIVVLPIAGLPQSRGCQPNQAGKITVGDGRDMSERCRDRPRARTQAPNDRKGNRKGNDCGRYLYNPAQLKSTIMARRYRTETTLQVAQSPFRTWAGTEGIGLWKMHGLISPSNAATVEK